MQYTILFLYNLNAAWLRLTPQQRQDFRGQHLQPIFERYQASVQVTFCDSEAFSGRCSDFAIFQATDLPQFYFLFEKLRSTPLFTEPYLSVVDLIVGLQDGHRVFHAAEAEASGAIL